MSLNKSYCVIPNQLYAGAIPASEDTTITEDRIKHLKELGIALIINLMESDERNYDGKLFSDYTNIAAQQGIAVSRISIRDLSVPTFTQMREILDLINQSIINDKKVYVHCWGGIGRTGTVVGCYLIENKFASRENVFNQIQELKSQSDLADRYSPETEEQMDFVVGWTSN